jgi:tetratricopeptide (TPR) repeat protein
LPRVQAVLESTRGRKSLESWAARPLAGFYGMLGRFDEGRALLAEARSVMEELGRPLEATVLAFWTGPLEMLAGDTAAAERAYRAACEELQSIGEKGWLSTMAGLWADVLYELDRLDEAAAAVGLSRDATTSDDYNAQALWRCAEAKLAARRGAFEEAEALALEAIDFIGRSDELNNQAHVQLGLVEVHRLAGRPEDAIRALDDAIARFEQKGNVVMTERSRALRDELSATNR